MEIILIPIKGQHPFEGGIREISGIQVDVAKAFEPRFASFTADIREIKRRRQHLLTIPYSSLAHEEFQILSHRIHIHIDWKT
jgi:hypothetical protein